MFDIKRLRLAKTRGSGLKKGLTSVFLCDRVLCSGWIGTFPHILQSFGKSPSVLILGLLPKDRRWQRCRYPEVLFLHSKCLSPLLERLDSSRRAVHQLGSCTVVRRICPEKPAPTPPPAWITSISVPISWSSSRVRAGAQDRFNADKPPWGRLFFISEA
jgi:hypothetical protein